MSQNWKWKSLALLAIAALPAGAQGIQRRAAITGGQPGGQGKCTVEVWVDGTAEVEIRGDSALLRTLGGQPAQWRRFECTSPMPPQPAGFRFAGVDGRGRQQLIADPGRGGPAVIRIEDQQGGAEGYTFDIFWGGFAQNGPPPGGFGPDRDRDRDFDRNRPPDRAFARPYATEEAVRACQDAATDQAIQRFRVRDVTIRRAVIDDGLGRNDWVVGMLEGRRGRDFDRYRFSCSVDFRGRRIRSVSVDLAGDRR